MEAAAVHPGPLGSDVTELIEDAADHLVGSALPAEHLELRHHAIECHLDAGHRGAGVTVTLAVQLMVTAQEFLAVELREQGHTKQGVHVVLLACRGDSLYSSEPRHRVSTGDLARPHPPREGARQQRRH